MYYFEKRKNEKKIYKDIGHTCIELETGAKFFTSSQVGCQDPQCVAALSLVLKGRNAVMA